MSDKPRLPRLNPDIRLFGPVNNDMLSEFFRQQSGAPDHGPIVLELSSNGGAADLGRRIAQELRLWQEKEDRQVWFLGKTSVFSAGVTIMSAVPPERRYLTADCELLIHERKMTRDIHLDGALRGCRSTVMDILAEIDSGQRLERYGFEMLTRGTKITVDELEKRVLERDWYLTAQEALDHGLIAGII